MYCREYNRTVAWLVEKYGVPDWAPVRRLPTAASLLGFLTGSGVPFVAYSAASPSEQSIADFVLSYWKGCVPALWVRLEQVSLLVWGGEFSDGVGRVDVIDTLEEVRWMAVYRFPREEYVVLPWDPSSH
jgi:hypothetical protein